MEMATFLDMPCIEAGTRLLTPVDSNAWEPALSELKPSVDPDGVVREIVGSGKCKFTEDNVVNYSELVPAEGDGFVKYLLNS
jgi:hypothetical protein